MRIFITLSQTIERLWLTAMFTLLLVGVILVSPAAAQGNGTGQLTVVAPAINVRSGPGLAYPAFDTLRQGDQVPVISYDAASDWWQVKLFSGSTGWVSGGADYVSVSGAEADLVVTAAKQSEIAASPKTSSESGTLVFQAISGGPIYAVNSDGANLRYLTTGMDPALSPDGQWVAFTRWDNPQMGAKGSLWLINVDGSGERLVAENIFQPKSPTWSPDGTHIIVSMAYGEHLQPEYTCTRQRPKGMHNLSKTNGLWCYFLPPKPDWGMRQINVSTGQAEDLNYDTNSISPTWDPSNPQRVVYDGTWGLVNLDLSTGKTSPLTTDAQNHSPAFSPDGSKLAVSYRQDDHWEVHILNADGSGDVRLTGTSYLAWVQQELNGQAPHSYSNAAPAWSPDGNEIAFITDRSGVWEIWVMNVDGSQQRPLVTADKLAGIKLQYDGMNERVLSWR